MYLGRLDPYPLPSLSGDPCIAHMSSTCLPHRSAFLTSTWPCCERQEKKRKKKASLSPGVSYLYPSLCNVLLYRIYLPAYFLSNARVHLKYWTTLFPIGAWCSSCMLNSFSSNITNHPRSIWKYLVYTAASPNAV
ncbi:hypothetical protein F4821DRAFT_39673 [Hypoxylon rubiginosum]|uniref:Uncharacterized protein n=1 Tax=Hypoxylon rubiginosum TaxID=110542 RepID=A0ACC0CKY7_9PEZI|nr:hypothetical protein F4821DRAFT_39673 [Hypoxylon rubiginosum]